MIEISVLPCSKPVQYRKRKQRPQAAIQKPRPTVLDKYKRRNEHVAKLFPPSQSILPRPSAYRRDPYNNGKKDSVTVALRPRLGDLLKTSPKQKQALIQLEKIRTFLQPLTQQRHAEAVKLVSDAIVECVRNITAETSEARIRAQLAVEPCEQQTVEQRYADHAQSNATVYGSVTKEPRAPKKLQYKATCPICGQQLSTKFFARHLAKCLSRPGR
ncbi:SAGA complex Sgf11 subunit [Carpediemonas membranifera]|uniref:SAGA complex Sgf11 subunit n=1 Tax=Carpediemonas membranifera TaxID=201153 RepID=A0A8J6B0K9_9EUKA|nr:SAGA complex Sgf11 subunit [Carpediemonas membranifera]|eukprot:KAG9395835.1 SAGA complex Sgf11 subunit [Carpediemonas membranifera]